MTTGNFAQTSAYLFALGLSLVSFSCAVRPKSSNPAETKVELPSGAKLSQVGFAEEPASLSEADSSASFDLPKGSVVTVSQPSETSPGNILVKLSANSSLKLGTKWTKAETAKSFRPSAPPSLTEQANADAVKQSYWFAGGLLLFAGLLAWGQHYKAAAIAGSGAIIVPLAARFIAEINIVWLVAVFVSIAVTLFVAWYLVIGRMKEPVEPAKTP